jgi:hypothetical protein
LTRQLKSGESKKKDQVKVAAPPAAVKEGHYDMVSFLNMISSKAVIKNWSIRDMVPELKDGDIIDTPKIKTFVQGLNAECAQQLSTRCSRQLLGS